MDDRICEPQSDYEKQEACIDMIFCCISKQEANQEKINLFFVENIIYGCNWKMIAS